MTEMLIPGDPTALDALASQLGSTSAHLDALRGRVAADELRGSWSGAAADAFRASLNELPGEVSKATHAFDEARQAISRFSGDLVEHRQRAHLYERQIEDARREQEAAEARRVNAEMELDGARLRQSATTDPVSLHAAKAAVDVGESALAHAVADVEEARVDLERLVGATARLREEYERDVAICCAALDGITQTGGHSLIKWMGAYVNGITRHLDEAGAAGRFLWPSEAGGAS